ncbi:MAG: hypothetical protein H6Q10_587 [Acidobacteria bacterium]|nr:hypothetical protein [Acidobacteriota bacterium]
MLLHRLCPWHAAWPVPNAVGWQETRVAARFVITAVVCALFGPTTLTLR